MLPRDKIRRGLSSLYIPYYNHLVTLPKEFQPYDGLRTFEQQDQLWAIGRSLPGKPVTSAKGGQSAHNYGCATDWAIYDGKNFVWPDKTDSIWLPYIKMCKDLGGLKSGSAWGDFPHNELKLTCSWEHVLVQYKLGGMSKAQEHIEGNIIWRCPPV